jgi:hypothetical protein
VELIHRIREDDALQHLVELYAKEDHQAIQIRGIFIFLWNAAHSPIKSERCDVLKEHRASFCFLAADTEVPHMAENKSPHLPDVGGMHLL